MFAGQSKLRAEVENLGQEQFLELIDRKFSSNIVTDSI